jgi:hypothetical protein
MYSRPSRWDDELARLLPDAKQLTRSAERRAPRLKPYEFDRIPPPPKDNAALDLFDHCPELTERLLQTPSEELYALATPMVICGFDRLRHAEVGTGRSLSPDDCCRLADRWLHPHLNSGPTSAVMLRNLPGCCLAACACSAVGADRTEQEPHLNMKSLSAYSVGILERRSQATIYYGLEALALGVDGFNVTPDVAAQLSGQAIRWMVSGMCLCIEAVRNAGTGSELTESAKRCALKCSDFHSFRGFLELAYQNPKCQPGSTNQSKTHSGDLVKFLDHALLGGHSGKLIRIRKVDGVPRSKNTDREDLRESRQAELKGVRPGMLFALINRHPGISTLREATQLYDFRTYSLSEGVETCQRRRAIMLADNPLLIRQFFRSCKGPDFTKGGQGKMKKRRRVDGPCGRATVFRSDNLADTNDGNAPRRKQKVDEIDCVLDDCNGRLSNELSQGYRFDPRHSRPDEFGPPYEPADMPDDPEADSFTSEGDESDDYDYS